MLPDTRSARPSSLRAGRFTLKRNDCSTALLHESSSQKQRDSPAHALLHHRHKVRDRHVDAVASAAIGLGIAVRARGLARGRIGQDPPRRGWRMQDEVTAAMDGPINYAHLTSS
jgi:hypothetical protein